MNGVIRSTKAGDNGWSIEDYTQEIEKNPRNSDAFNNRGFLYFNMGNFKQALADFNEARRKTQKPEIEDYNCGLAYFFNNLFDQSIMSLNNAIKVFKNHLVDNKDFILSLTTAYYYCGLAHLHKGDYEQAIKNLQEADRLDPNNQEILQALKETQKY